MESELVKTAKKIIEENIYFTLGTSSKNNRPWVTPLFYSFDENLNLYWLSPKSSLHSKNIKGNSETSVVLFDSRAPKWTGLGVYMSGNTFEIEDKDEVEKGLRLENERLEEPIPSYEGFIGDNEYRVYKFVPSKIWITHDIKDEKGNTIDHRAEIKKEDLLNSF